MTNELADDLRRMACSLVKTGHRQHLAWKAADEIERLNRKCSALAYLQYGSAGPDDPWQTKLDEVTKPLHAEIESLRKALDNRGRQLGIQPTVHEPEKQA